MNVLWSRLAKRWLILAIIIALIISFLQFVTLTKIPIEDSPYTRWLSIDSFNFAPIVFFILLPIFSSLPASIMLKEDYDSGLLYKWKLQKSIKQVLFDYIKIAFITGFIVTALALSANLFSWFMILPNIKPDNLLNKNILVINFNTLFVSLYYTHPFIHAILSIIFAAFWSGLFAVFVTVTSLWVKNKFAAACSGLVLQIVLLLFNNLFKLPNLVSYAPADFLHETAPTTNISLPVTMIVTLLLMIYCGVMFYIDQKKLINL
ncbi:MAG: hypothetical protein J6565_00140 [Lactobacillus sp.]|nr:hypothetical protein [Lactobacillus sp.]